MTQIQGGAEPAPSGCQARVAATEQLGQGEVGRTEERSQDIPDFCFLFVPTTPFRSRTVLLGPNVLIGAAKSCVLSH